MNNLWNKRREDVLPPPVRVDGAYSSNETAAPIAVVLPVRQPEEARRGGASLGPSIVIKGDIFSSEELFIDGEVEGKMELQSRLTIGKNGKIKANIKAREIVVYGSVQGDLFADDKIVIRKDGNVVGDVKTAGIVIEDGAYFKGGIDILRPDPKQ